MEIRIFCEKKYLKSAATLSIEKLQIEVKRDVIHSCSSMDCGSSKLKIRKLQIPRIENVEKLPNAHFPMLITIFCFYKEDAWILELLQNISFVCNLNTTKIDFSFNTNVY